MAKKRQRGRPTKFTQKLCDDICAKISEGKSVRTICESKDMPAMSTIFKWLRESEVFSEQYVRAKEFQADAFTEEMLDIADDGTNDWMEKFSKDGDSVGWMVNGEAVQRSRIRLDTRKWLASKMKPKKYGDKTTTEITGKDGGAIEHRELPSTDIWIKGLLGTGKEETSKTSSED